MGSACQGRGARDVFWAEQEAARDRERWTARAVSRPGERPSAGPWLGEGAGRLKVDWAGRGKEKRVLGSGWFVGFWAGFLPISFSFLFLFILF